LNKIKSLHKTFFIVTGIIGIICAIFDLWYKATTLMTSCSGAFDKMTSGRPIPFFHQAFYAMSVICVLFYILPASILLLALNHPNKKTAAQPVQPASLPLGG
jgi:cellulose synthase/poly-beta-1,6-N-acetylglucosamine synthase-like glycosyltransferase